jgi:hypothetical protein
MLETNLFVRKNCQMSHGAGHFDFQIMSHGQKDMDGIFRNWSIIKDGSYQIETQNGWVVVGRDNLITSETIIDTFSRISYSFQ